MFGGKSAGGNPVNCNAAIVGDSITANAGMSSFWWINGLTGGHLCLLKNAGIGSERIAATTARINNQHTNATPGLGGLSLGWVFVRIGTNDAAIDYPLSSADGDYDALITALLPHAPRIVFMAVPSLSTNSAIPQDYNGYLASVCASNPSRLTFVDDCVDLRSGNNQVGTYFSDGVHPNAKGTYTMGVRGAADATLLSLLAQYGTQSPLFTAAPFPIFPYQPQYNKNPGGTGVEGGGLGTGFTGFLTPEWDIERVGSSLAATCSRVSADATDQNQTPWQRIALTTGEASGAIRCVYTLHDLDASANGPYNVDIAIELRLNAVNTVAMNDFSIFVEHSEANEYLAPPAQLLCYNSGTITKTAILRSAMRRNNSNAHSNSFFVLRCESDGNPASPGSFDFRCMKVFG